jgi:hypothetical protein
MNDWPDQERCRIKKTRINNIAVNKTFSEIQSTHFISSKKETELEKKEQRKTEIANGVIVRISGTIYATR